MHDVYLHSEFWIASPASVQPRVKQAQQTALFEYVCARPGQTTVLAKAPRPDSVTMLPVDIIETNADTHGTSYSLQSSSWADDSNI